MTDQPESSIGTAERYRCPISTCPWVYDPPSAPALHPGVLAHIFGPGVMAQIAANQYRAKIERALEDHCNTHTIAEYVAEIGNLTGLVIGLTAQVGQLTAIDTYGQKMLADLAGPMTGILGQYPTAGD